jgi:hypothetical protein
LIKVYPVQFFVEDERSGFNWGLPLFNNHAFKPVSPEIAAPIVTLPLTKSVAIWKYKD